MKFVVVKNDVAFRKIFGNDKKTEILISFLNAVLGLKGDKRIKAITIANPYQLPILPNMKTSIIDVKATDFHGNTFIVEMQELNLLTPSNHCDPLSKTPFHKYVPVNISKVDSVRHLF